MVDDQHTRRTDTGAQERRGGRDGDVIRRPDDQETTYAVGSPEQVAGARERGFDVLATIAGALAALGTLLILASLVSAAAGTIGYQTGVDGRDLSVGGLVGGLVILFLACLVGGWVAGRVAGHRGALHGLVVPLWLLLLAGVLAVLAAVFGDDLDVRDRVGLPDWFDRDALGVAAIISGVVALLLMLLGGWLGGRLADRHRQESAVSVVERRRAVRTRPGGIVGGTGRSGR